MDNKTIPWKENKVGEVVKGVMPMPITVNIPNTTKVNSLQGKMVDTGESQGKNRGWQTIVFSYYVGLKKSKDHQFAGNSNPNQS